MYDLQNWKFISCLCIPTEQVSNDASSAVLAVTFTQTIMPLFVISDVKSALLKNDQTLAHKDRQSCHYPACKIASVFTPGTTFRPK